MRNITIVSGEESGERYGALLAIALRDRLPDARFSGMGGDEMRKAGVRLINDISDLSVMGFFEVLSKLWGLMKAFRRLREHLSDERQDLLILIDFPDFNIRLARYARKRGIKILYFIGPQVWAWRKERVKLIAQLVDRIIVIFPFEVDFYSRYGVETKFVGHPLIDVIAGARRQHNVGKELGVPEGNRIIGLLPGSRNSEVKRILPVMLAGASLLNDAYKRLSFIIPVAKNVERKTVRRIAEPFGKLGIFFSYDDYYGAIDTIDFAIVASGTATVELALMEKPMVVVYRMNPLSYLLARTLVNVKNIAMVNLISGREVVPELLQSKCNPGAIFAQMKTYLDDESKVLNVKDSLKEIRAKLGEQGMFRRSAEIIAGML